MKPCPFCGSSSVDRVERDTGEKIIHFYGCTDCNALGPDSRDVEQALERWNARTDNFTDDAKTLAIVESASPQTGDSELAGFNAVPRASVASETTLSESSARKGGFDSRSLTEDGCEGSRVRNLGTSLLGNSPVADSGETNGPGGQPDKASTESGAGAFTFEQLEEALRPGLTKVAQRSAEIELMPPPEVLEAFARSIDQAVRKRMAEITGPVTDEYIARSVTRQRWKQFPHEERFYFGATLLVVVDYLKMEIK